MTTKTAAGTRIRIERDDKYASVGTFMTLSHFHAGTHVIVSVRIGGLRPRYLGRRSYADGSSHRMSALGARLFVADCLRPVRFGGAS